MRYKVAILDIDGTLIDSNDAHAHAWVRALEQHGPPVPFEDVRTRIGMGGDKLFQQIGIDSESSKAHQVTAARRAIFAADYLPHLRPTRGARRMIEWLRSEGAVVVIATSAEPDEIKGLLRAAGVDDLIACVASADDDAHSKPDPDVVLAALSKSKQPRDRAIMIGDTPYDIQAATAAGIAAVALRTGGWSDRDLADAAAIFDDPYDIVEHKACLPFLSEDGTP